jgi:hypothetical protein
VISQKNEIDHLPSSSRLFFTKEENEVKLLMLTTVPFGLLELTLNSDYSISQTVSAETIFAQYNLAKVRSYDQLIVSSHLNTQS